MSMYQDFDRPSPPSDQRYPPFFRASLSSKRDCSAQTRTVALRAVRSRADRAGAPVIGRTTSRTSQQGTAVVDGAVGLVEEPDTVQQVAQLRAGEAIGAPVDLGRAAAPGHLFEDRPVALSEHAVEAGIMGDDDDRVGDEGRDHVGIDALPGDHVVGDTGHGRRLGRDRRRWLIARRKDVPDAHDAAVPGVVDETIPSSMTSSRERSRTVVSVSSRMAVLTCCPVAGVEIEVSHQGQGPRRGAQGARSPVACDATRI